MASTEMITTADQLLRATGLGRCELVRGELMMMSPGGSEHGRLIGRITVALGSFIAQNSLGEILGAETGFQIAHQPDTVRAPDVAFVSRERCPTPTVRQRSLGSIWTCWVIWRTWRPLRMVQLSRRLRDSGSPFTRTPTVRRFRRD